jgi:hypothetical protein
MEAVLFGSIPLCYASVSDAMVEKHQRLRLAEGNRLAVKNIDVLFAWLWKSKDGQFERKGWNKKPYRMLFQQSFHAIKMVRGKAGARKWRQNLKRSFLGSHWVLPYPNSRGFIRKDKEEQKFIWWPSVHQRLIMQYTQSPHIGTLANPLPASNIQHHPADGWRLATISQFRGYMPFVVQPEQKWIGMPESELYASLASLREQVTAGLFQPLPTAPTLRLDDSLAPPFPYRYCNITRTRIVKTFEECDDVNDCIWFLRKGLDAYETLCYYQPSRRKRGRTRKTTNLDSNSDSALGSDETGMTSDEDSLPTILKKQGQKVRIMDMRVCELIGKFQK